MKTSRNRFWVIFTLLLGACGVAAGNPDRPSGKLYIDKRYPSAATKGTPLTLQGRFFGTEQGKVRIDGHSAEILKWSADEIVVSSPGDATTACGYARVVSADGSVSNAVPFAYGDRGVWMQNGEVPAAREYPISVWTGEEMFVWGGGSATGGRYNPRTDTWLPVSSIGAPRPNMWLGAATALWTGREVLVWADFSAGGRYNPGIDAWTPFGLKGFPVVESTTPMATGGNPLAVGASAVWTGKEMIVWGGDGGARYNPETDSWTAMSDEIANEPKATARLHRQYHSAVWTGEVMIIWGGFLPEGKPGVGTPFSDGAAYDPDTDTWTALPEGHGLSPRGFHQATWTGKEMLIWGGMTSYLPDFTAVKPSGARYNPRKKKWSPINYQGMPTGVVGPASAWTGDQWIIYGGSPTPMFDAAPTTDGARYDPATDQWTPLAHDAKHLNGTAVWTGTEMLVWGGIGDGAVPTASGSRYDPQQDRWAPIAGSTNPSSRTGFSMIWTGSEVIVWGGYQNTELTTTEFADVGARYNPVTNEWVLMNEPGAPRGRIEHTAIWADTKMIIWGGDESGTSPDDYSKRATTAVAYDPATRSWSTLSSIGMPAGKLGASAVWTGDKMVVWGGGGSGGVYEPATDTWSLMNQTGAPVTRYGAHLVWTGKEAIVYGGGRSGDRIIGDFKNGFEKSGARYNPSTNKWAPIPAEDFLDIGNVNSTLWTGSEYVIIGSHYLGPVGDEGDKSLYGIHEAQGGRYDPETNRWTPMSLKGTPINERSEAIWTGSEILVFSPPSDRTQLAKFMKGFRYSPSEDTWSTIRCGCGTYDMLNKALWGSPSRAVWTGTSVQLWGLYGGFTYRP